MRASGVEHGNIARGGAVERVFAAAALAFLLGRLGPFVNEREGDAEFAGNLFGTGLLEGVAEDFV